MKLFKKMVGCVLCLTMMLSIVVPGLTAGASNVIEHHLILPEDFSDNLGSWTVTDREGAFNGKTLFGLTWRDTSVTSPAVTTVDVETAGEYTLWVHAYELTNTPEQLGAWEFEVAVDGTKVGSTFGGGNREVSAFVWVKAGTVTLDAGTHEISLIDTYADWPRCDALFLTNDATLTPSDDFATLQEQAASGGVVEEEEVVYFTVDNTDDGVQKNGPEDNWLEYTDASASGGSYFVATGSGSDIVSFAWSLALDTAGYWAVEAYIPEAPEDKEISAEVTYQINAGSGISSVVVDQTTASGWVSLGTYSFSADGTESIKVAPEKNGTDWILVDAVRLSYLGEYNPETTIVVDNEDTENTVLTGSFPGTSGAGWLGESTYRQGYIGENYYSLHAGDSEATLAWKFAVPQAGYYEVFVNLPDGSSGDVDSGVSYEIYAYNDTVTVQISHNQPAGYFSLGKYYFEATTEAVALLKIIGPTEGACMVDAAKIEFIGETLEANKGYYEIDLSDPQQTILGLGVEIQSDSLGSGNTMDANDTSGHSVPHDLTESERERFYSDLLSGFRYIRLAGGLFYRGTDAEGKHLTERWDTQDEELAEMIEKSGVEGFNLEFWSPTPYFKSNGEYHGGKLKCFDESWEYYGDEEKTNEFLTEFGETLIEDFKRMEADGLPIVQFSLQNEPDLQSVYGTYSFCYYNDDDYYKACCVLLPMLKEAFPDLKIHVNSWNGQHSGAAWSIKDNPEVLACVDMWSFHTVGYNSDVMITESESNFNYGTNGLPVFNAEFEYQPSDFTGQYDFRFVNTAQAIMNWMVFENSPTWYWLHSLKPLGNEESIGYSLGMWRKSGDTTQYTFSSDEQSEYWNSVEEKTWAYNYPNYNALRGFLEFMPWDSVRYSVVEDETRLNQRIMAWKTPEGKMVFAVTNRDSASPFTFNVDTGIDSTFKGYALTAYAEEMVELGTQEGTVETTLDAYSIQFWVEDDSEPAAPVNVVFQGNSGETLATIELAEGDIIDASVIPAAPVRYGYTFIGWSYDVNMPIVADTVITALYEKNTNLSYTITAPDDVKITLPEGQSVCYYNDRVTIQAPEKGVQKFSYWKVNGAIFSYSRKISFLMFGDVEIEAVYGAETAHKNVIFIDSNPTTTDKFNGKYDMHIMGVVHASEGEVTEIGVLLAAGEYTAEEMTNGTATTVKLVATKASADRQFVYTVKNIAYGKVRTAITYAVIDGVTYYSEVSCTAVLEFTGDEYGGGEVVEGETSDPFN